MLTTTSIIFNFLTGV